MIDSILACAYWPALARYGAPPDARAARARPVSDPTARIGVVDIVGPIGPADVGGWVSVPELRDRLRALADAPVDAVLLRVDSPGGVVGGIDEIAGLVRRLAETRPVIAYGDPAMYSAAYWIASAASAVIVPPTGGTGAIGVVAVHGDLSDMLARMGIRTTIVRSPARKGEGSPLEPLSAPARAALDAEVRRLAQLFAADVARYRGRTVDAILGLEGRALDPLEALQAGLIDMVGTEEAAVGWIRRLLGLGRGSGPALPASAKSAMRAVVVRGSDGEIGASGTAEAPVRMAEEAVGASVSVDAEAPTPTPVVADPVASEGSEALPDPAAGSCACRAIVELCAVAQLDALEALTVLRESDTVDAARAALLRRQMARADRQQVAAPATGPTASIDVAAVYAARRRSMVGF